MKSFAAKTNLAAFSYREVTVRTQLVNLAPDGT